MNQTTRNRIETYLLSQNGVVRTSEFQKAGLHNSYLTEMVEEGVLIRLKSGLYLTTEKQTVSGFYEIQLALPNAVICLASALSFYEMTTYEPPSVHIAIPRDNRTLPPDFPPVKKFSFGASRYNLGITKIESEGHKISIYDPEKTLCDAIRYRRTLGQDIVNEAVRNYLSGPETKIAQLVEYSRILKSEGPVKSHLRLMS